MKKSHIRKAKAKQKQKEYEERRELYVFIMRVCASIYILQSGVFFALSCYNGVGFLDCSVHVKGS